MGDALYLQIISSMKNEDLYFSSLLRKVNGLVQRYPSNGDYLSLKGDIIKKAQEERTANSFTRFERMLHFKDNYEDSESIIEIYRKALRLGTSKKEHYDKNGYTIEQHTTHELIIEYLEKDHNESAKTLLKKLIKLDPKDPDPYFHLGQLARIDGKLDDSLKNLKKSENLHTNLASDDLWPVLGEIGITYGMKQEYEKSIEYFGKQLEQKQEPIVYLNMFHSLVSLERNHEALDCLNHLLLEDPKNPIALVSKAELELNMENYECCLATCRLAIQCNLNWDDAIQMGLLETDSKHMLEKNSEALKSINSILEMIGGNNLIYNIKEKIRKNQLVNENEYSRLNHALHLKFEILMDLGKFGEAEEVIEQIISLNNNGHSNYHKTEVLVAKAYAPKIYDETKNANLALKNQNKSIKKFKIDLKKNLDECQLRIKICTILKDEKEILRVAKIMQKYFPEKISERTSFDIVRANIVLENFSEVEKFFNTYKPKRGNPHLIIMRAINHDFHDRYDLAINDVAFCLGTGLYEKKDLPPFSDKLKSDKRYKLLLK